MAPLRQQTTNINNADYFSFVPLRTNFSEIRIKNTKICIQENEIEYVASKMETILSRPQCGELICDLYARCFSCRAVLIHWHNNERLRDIHPNVATLHS